MLSQIGFARVSSFLSQCITALIRELFNAKKSSVAANLISKTSSTPIQLNVLLTNTIQHRKYRNGATLDIWCWISFHGYSLESTPAAQNLHFKCRFWLRTTKDIYIYIVRVSDLRSLRRIWLLLESSMTGLKQLCCSAQPPSPAGESSFNGTQSISACSAAMT